MKWAEGIRLGVMALGAFALSGCNGDVSFESGADAIEVSLESDPFLSLLEQSVQAPWTTTFRGTRRIELRYFEPDGQEVTLAYREDVAADGQGNFALNTAEVLSFLPDPNLFQVLQETREGFLYRYRDFKIYDLNAFFQSYLAQDVGNEVQIAGRTAREMLVTLPQGGGCTFQVFLDTETGLPLKAIETDAAGIQVALMEFESYDPAPDFSDVAWFDSGSPETALDPFADLSQQAGFEVLTPALLPSGYQPWKAATLVDSEGMTWAKQTFTDGVHPLFLLHRDVAEPAVVAPGGGKVATSKPISDRLWVYSIGPVTVVEGILRKRRVVVLGRTDSELLLDLLESAID